MVDGEIMATRIALTCFGSKLRWRLGMLKRGLTIRSSGPHVAAAELRRSAACERHFLEEGNYECCNACRNSRPCYDV